MQKRGPGWAYECRLAEIAERMNMERVRRRTSEASTCVSGKSRKIAQRKLKSDQGGWRLTRSRVSWRPS